MSAPTPAVERAAKALWGFGSSNFDWGQYVDDATSALAAALTDPDDPDWLARTLFTLALIARDSGFTVESAAMVWREDIEATHTHWRRIADGLRMILTGEGA